MKRPIKNFDFVLLTTKEYCFKYFWPIIALSVVSSIFLGLWLNDSLALRPDYVQRNMSCIERTGFPLIVASLITTTITINPLVLYLLNKFTREYNDRRKLKFLSIYSTCEKEYKAILQKQTKYNADIVDEYLTYKSVMTADNYLWRNRMKNRERKEAEQEG